MSTQGLVGDSGERGEKGIQNDTSDVIVYWPITYRFSWRLDMVKYCAFVKYHVSEDMPSIVESSGGVQTLRNVSAYHEPAWHFVNGQRHVRANESDWSWSYFRDEELGVPLPL